MKTMPRLLALLCFTPLLSLAAAPSGIVIHGGAGTINKAQLTDTQRQAYEATLKHAAEQGYAVLQQGGSSLDAVTRAVMILEDSPLFNAGKGAVYTYDESHELDASIMQGQDRQAGAIAGVSTIKNPILLARAVMERSEHVMLAGAGAEAFAVVGVSNFNIVGIINHCNPDLTLGHIFETMDQ